MSKRDFKIWVTSDHHFGHKNIIKYCNRPFQTVEEMRDEMVERWNSVVSDGDVVFHLGDVSLGRIDYVSDTLKSLKGHKVLIYGNHDQKSLRESNIWDIRMPDYQLEYSGFTVNMRHHPWEQDRELDKNNIWLHGHSHGALGTFHDGQIDVGVDSWNYTPVDMDVIVEQHLKNFFGE